MSDNDWMPGAERVAGAHLGGTLVGGPPRCTWHITWDHLDPRPTFNNVRDYLVRMNYEPTIMWDPETGRVADFIPASRAAYAVANRMGGVETNRLGDPHVQIEVFFSPGYKGRAVFTDGPMIGLEGIMSWLDDLGIPRQVAGDFARPIRDIAAWRTRAGHFGHSMVPENDHGDPPGPTDMGLVLAAGTSHPAPSPEDDDMRKIATLNDTTPDERTWIFWIEPKDRTLWFRLAEKDGSGWLTDPDQLEGAYLSIDEAVPRAGGEIDLYLTGIDGKPYGLHDNGVDWGKPYSIAA